MSIREPHTLSFRNPGLPPEEVDTLLRNFFRSEMPEPWPILKAPAEEPFLVAKKSPARWTPTRSRVALAASVALLLLGSWCFSAKAPDYSMPPQSSTPGAGSASNRPLYEGSFKVNAPKPTEVKKVGCCGGCCEK